MTEPSIEELIDVVTKVEEFVREVLDATTSNRELLERDAEQVQRLTGALDTWNKTTKSLQRTMGKYSKIQQVQQDTLDSILVRLKAVEDIR